MKYKVGDRVSIKLGKYIGGLIFAKSGVINRSNKSGYIVYIDGEPIFFTEDEIESKVGGNKE